MKPLQEERKICPGAVRTILLYCYSHRDAGPTTSARKIMNDYFRLSVITALKLYDSKY
jgi:hypothetical protein